jgi:hypothetical protein
MVTECIENYKMMCARELKELMNQTDNIDIDNKYERLIHIKKIYKLALSEYYDPFIMSQINFRKQLYAQVIKNIEQIDELEDIKNNYPELVSFFDDVKKYLESIGIPEQEQEEE